MPGKGGGRSRAVDNCTAAPRALLTDLRGRRSGAWCVRSQGAGMSS
ncbi:hypothetical protein GZL_03984 [Streptomyces sp. 769]|nr:hypothetical protein GZL_03984 [Streptomyces sp. 769]